MANKICRIQHKTVHWTIQYLIYDLKLPQFTYKKHLRKINLHIQTAKLFTSKLYNSICSGHDIKMKYGCWRHSNNNG